MCETEIELGVRRPDAARLAWAREVLADPKGKHPHRWSPVYAQEAQHLSKYPATKKIKLQAIRIGDLASRPPPAKSSPKLVWQSKKKALTRRPFISNWPMDTAAICLRPNSTSSAAMRRGLLVLVFWKSTPRPKSGKPCRSYCMRSTRLLLLANASRHPIAKIGRAILPAGSAFHRLLVRDRAAQPFRPAHPFQSGCPRQERLIQL